MAKGKRKGGDIFRDLKDKRYEELEELRSRKTTRRTLPKLEKALGVTESGPAPAAPVQTGAPTELAAVEVGQGRRRTRRGKKAGRRTRHRK